MPRIREVIGFVQVRRGVPDERGKLCAEGLDGRPDAVMPGMAVLQSRRCAKGSTGAGAPATRSVPLHRYLPALPLGLGRSCV